MAGNYYTSKIIFILLAKIISFYIKLTTIYVISFQLEKFCLKTITYYFDKFL